MEKQSIKKKAIKYLKANYNSSFSDDIGNNGIADDIIDAYVAGFEAGEGKSVSTSEKDLRVCEVIASAWISVKKRQPEFGVSVLWLDKYKLMFLGDLQEVEGMTALCTDTGYSSFRDSGVTHWTLLPEPPK